jgi:hypothetical protein
MTKVMVAVPPGKFRDYLSSGEFAVSIAVVVRGV